MLPRVATEYGQRSWARVIRSAACPAVRFGARQLSLPGFSSFLSFDLDALGVSASLVAVLDDFRVLGLPLCPHPHAGFAAVTYVLEDSPGDLRSRASSGIDIVVGPGGIVRTHAGNGVVHDEVPAVPGREVHEIQIFAT